MNFRILFAVMTAFLVASHAVADDDGLSYADFAAGMSPQTNTSLGIDAFWRGHYKQIVTWSAEVVEVKGHRRGAVIYLAKSGYPLYRGYNIVLAMTDQNAASVLQRGDHLKFRGSLNRYKARPGHPLVVSLSHGQLLNAVTSIPKELVSRNPQNDFAVFAAMLSRDNNTELAAKTNWGALKRQVVTWEAKVVEVKGGRRGADVYLAAAGAPLYHGYNIILDNSDLARAGILKKEQVVTVRGIPVRYSHRFGNPVVVTLKSGEILEVRSK